MKKQIVSFRDFLRTGNIGPVSPTMKMIEIAKLLGAPDDWMTHDNDHAPLYWCYGNLEISFDKTPQHKMHWFQIENAGYLEGDYELIADSLVLSLDGFSGQTKPSEFLGSGLWSPDAVKVFYAAVSDDILLNICAGSIQIFYRVDTDFIEDKDATRYLETTEIKQLIGDIDGRTEIDSIYSYPHIATEKLAGAFNWKSCNAGDYLRFKPCP